MNYVRYGSGVGPGPGVAPDINVNAQYSAAAFGTSLGGQASAQATGVLLLVLAGLVLWVGWKGL